jgi:hypothetical protein
MSSLRLSLSRQCWIITIAVSLVYYGTQGKESYSLYGDALGYYLYLPSTFIYHNHKNITELPADRGITHYIIGAVAGTGEGRVSPKGYPLNQYTYGTALMEAPFFFIAHAWELATGAQANGFSTSYRAAIGVSTLVYAALGLWLVYRLLRKKFSPQIASIATALLLLGTNLFWFTFHQQGMAHIPLFFLFAALLQLTIAIHEDKGSWYWGLLGFVAGLITVIRPLDGLCVIIPVLYSTGRPYFRSKLVFLATNWQRVLLASACFLLPIIPQLLYWQWLTGHLVYDSYGPNQRFNFLQPQILKGLFAASNGWLAYSPLMFLALAGLFYVKKLTPFALAIPAFLVLYIWGIYSWYAPHYPNGLGSRPMVDVYPLLAFPLAAAISWILNRGILLRSASALFIIASIALNLHYSIAQAKGSLWSEDSKWSYNLQTLFHYKPAYNDLVVWDIGIPQPKQSSITVIQPPTCIDTNYEIRRGEEYPPIEIKQGYAPSITKATWVYCSARLMLPKWESSIYNNMVLLYQARRGSESLAWHAVRINNKLGLYEHPERFTSLTASTKENTWGQISFYIPLPKGFRPGDTLQLSLWNPAGNPAYLSRLCMGFYTSHDTK